jgi:hypothetical protein
MGTTINPFTGKIGGSSSNVRFNPLAGAFQFSGGVNTIKFDPVSGSFVFTGIGGEVDPLAGIAYRLRFETTWDKVALRPMWQDVARTIPVTGEGDQVATMGPDDAEFVPEQSDDSRQGALFLASDGTPYIDFDGTDDNYPFGTTADPVVYTVLIRSKNATFNSYYGPVECFNTDGTARWGLFEAGQTYWHNNPFPVAVRRDGVALVSPFNCTPVNQWMVLTVTSNTPAAAAPRSIMQLNNQFFGAAELIALIIYDGAPSNADRDTVEAFYETLKPAP